jgi:hypothetical protein
MRVNRVAQVVKFAYLLAVSIKIFVPMSGKPGLKL